MQVGTILDKDDFYENFIMQVMMDKYPYSKIVHIFIYVFNC
jgi:hypothetical protein